VATVVINDKHLKSLYETGRSRKHDLPPQVVKKYFMRIQQFEAAERVSDLLVDSGMNFERYEDRYSVRLSKKFRLEVAIEWLDEDETRLGTVELLKVTAHYGD
jgi:proteic killer suppression protein